MQMLLYKYRPFSQVEYTLDILNSERLYCAHYRDLNDPFEGLFDLTIDFGDSEKPLLVTSESDIEDLVVDHETYEPLRVCSLSSNLHDVRLWGLYGGSCRGVAIEIDFGETTKALPVTYEETLPTYQEEKFLPSPKSALMRKTKHWQYEYEYRIITELEYWPIQGMIRRVIAGPRCTEGDRELLRKVAPASVPVIRSRLDRKNVRIEPMA